MAWSAIFRKTLFTILLAGLTFGLACNKLIEVVEPPDQIISGNVFEDDNTVRGAIAGIYSSNLATDSRTSTFSLYGGMCADELTPLTFNQFTTNSIPATDGTVAATWASLYNAIYQANAILEGLNSSTKITAHIRDQAIGEAKFIRAFCNFYLVNYWGDVPLILSTNIDKSIFQNREQKSKLWMQIISDLKEAKTLLIENYATAEKVRPNKWAATSLLARAHLYSGNWSEAEQEASQVIQSGLYTPLQPLNNVFLKNSKEAIWQIWTLNGFTNFAQVVIPGTATPNYVLTNDLSNSFENNDQRKVNWIKSFNFRSTNYYHPFKYKQQTANTGSSMEYVMVLRCAEQFLIRAEARARQDKIFEALQDVNVIRLRAGLPNIGSGITKDSCLIVIERERRSELFTEYSHRWLDLKRTNRIDIVLSLSKPTWKSTAALWPIPQTEIEKNQNLIQNQGY